MNRFAKTPYSILLLALCLMVANTSAQTLEDQANAAYERGRVAFERGDYQSAANAFQDSFNLKGHPQTAYFLSYCYLKIANFKDASWWAKQALSSKWPHPLDPPYADGAQQIIDFTKSRLEPPPPSPESTDGISMTTSAITSMPQPAVPGQLPAPSRLNASGLQDASRRMIEAHAVTGIQVRLATYGGNCGSTKGNATKDVGNGCDGKDRCNYVVDFKIIGDPAPGCTKDYELVYGCAGTQTVKSVRIFGEEAGLGKTVVLSCP